MSPRYSQCQYEASPGPAVSASTVVPPTSLSPPTRPPPPWSASWRPRPPGPAFGGRRRSRRLGRHSWSAGCLARGGGGEGGGHHTAVGGVHICPAKTLLDNLQIKKTGGGRHLCEVWTLYVHHCGGEYLDVAEDKLLSDSQGQLVETYGEYGRHHVLAGRACLLVGEVNLQDHGGDCFML